MRWSAGFVAVVCLCSTHSTQAAVRLPAVFGSHMVLQRGQAVPVWGWADPGEEVTVTFRDQQVMTKAGTDGKWSTQLGPLSVGEPGTFIVTGTNTITLEDVLVGEVWVCSGQSNMGWSVQASLDPDLEAAATGQAGIRLFQVPLVTKLEPQEDVSAQWRHCTPETIPQFSAVAYFFGRQLYETLDVPVGIIQTAWGGTPAEAWTRHDHLEGNPVLQPILDTWTERDQKWNPEQAQAEHAVAIEKWTAAVEQAKAAGKQPPNRPREPQDPKANSHHPSGLFNTMVAPLTPFAIKGAIWYQGETNASRAQQYRTLMPEMIKSWRADWSQGDFPFYQVQLANYRDPQPAPGESDWAELREAQMLAGETLPHVGAVCITDIGAAKDIHPRDKQNVGKRLARMALVDNYGYSQIVRSGPVYKSFEISADKCQVHFQIHGKSLAAYYNEPLSGFAIAGADHQWHWAQARIIDEDSVEVTHPEVPEPVAVRYNWADNPQGNLYNSIYLPAYPFRTDTWDGITQGKFVP